LKFEKFIICGEDKSSLVNIKNALVANGYIYIGYAKETYSILRHIRSHAPDLVIIDVSKRFSEIKQILEVVNEEFLCACILIMDIKNEEAMEFLKRTSIMTYLLKPIYNEILIQIAELTVVNFKRILEYEDKIKKLNVTLENRKLLEKAKWILVEKKNITEAEAYEWIKKKSRDNRKPMIEIASAIILTNE
jgi:Response regulator with putative antiterminator output domain